MKRSTLPRLVALAAATALALGACAPSGPGDDGADDGATQGAGDTSGGTLTVATTTDVVNFNPLIGNSRTDSWVTGLMYPRLLHINEQGAKEPALAVDWGWVDEVTGYWEIRDDMTWSDGEPVTAEDVAFTLNATKEDQPSGTLVGQLGYLDRAEAVSDTRVEVHLTEPDSSFVEGVGFWANIVPQHVFGSVPSVAEFANDSDWVSAGPYVLTEVQRGQDYVLEAVENYPLVEAGRPGPDEIVFRVYPDVNTEILALQNGDIDLIANALPPAQVAELQDADGITVEEIPGLGYAHMLYNMDREPLDDVLVRQALAHAVDYEAIREVVLHGQAVSTGSSPIMPVLADWYEELEEYEYDPELSRSLLEEAGYTAGSDGTYGLTFSLLYSLQDPIVSQWANLVRDGAAEAGITIELEGYERNTYLAKTQEGDYDIYAGTFAIMEDPRVNMSLTYLPDGFINYTHVDDPELSELINQARVVPEFDEQLRLVQEAARIVREQVYDNIMYTQNLYIAHSDEWTNFIVQPSELLSIVNPTSLASATRVG